MTQYKTTSLKRAVDRCTAAGVSLQKAYAIFMRLTRAEQDEAETLSADALRSARDLLLATNLLAGQVSETIRGFSLPEYRRSQVEHLFLNRIYAVAVTEDAVLLRVPLIPYSVQRNAQRRKAAGEEVPVCGQYYARRRYAEVDELLYRVLPIQFEGQKLLYLCHVYNTLGRYRMSPDFDNYDVKDLIDVVMAHYGGDNAGNVAVLHQSTYDPSLTSATYLAVTDLDSELTLRELMSRFRRCFVQLDGQYSA